MVCPMSASVPAIVRNLRLCVRIKSMNGSGLEANQSPLLEYVLIEGVRGNLDPGARIGVPFHRAIRNRRVFDCRFSMISVAEG